MLFSSVSRSAARAPHIRLSLAAIVIVPITVGVTYGALRLLWPPPGHGDGGLAWLGLALPVLAWSAALSAALGLVISAFLLLRSGGAASLAAFLVNAAVLCFVAMSYLLSR